MYNHGGALGSAAAAGTLPFTGLDVIWLVLAAFALLSAGIALTRITPRREG